MNQLDYLDFDVLFEKSGEEFLVRVLNSPSGQASTRFSLPFSPFEVENLLLRIGRTRKGVRRLESPEMEASRAFGSRLFSAVFDNEVLACLRSSLNASYRKGMGLRLRLRLSQAPELLDLPWEFLFDPTRNQFLVLSVDTPLVRYLDLQQEVQPLAVTPPINVLAMIASPVDYPPLDVAHEWEKLNEALGDLIERDLVSLTRLEKADLASLQRALRRGRYHVFHFIGHGGFDTSAQDGVLLTEGDNGRGRPVSGYDLGTLLHDHRSLRLAVLNACEGARSSLTDPFAGTAQSLVQNGIPAVIAMQFEITDEAAILLAHEFYGALADGYPVDASLAEARKAIFAQGNDVEWATPVLYLRTADASIFQIEQTPKTTGLPSERPPQQHLPGAMPPVTAPETGAPVWPGDFAAGETPAGGETPALSTSRQAGQARAEVNRLYTQGLSAFWLDDWEQASQSFEAVLQLEPGHAEAAARLETARRNLALLRLQQQAQAAEAAGEWEKAVAALEQLVDQSPAQNKEAQARLEAARVNSQVADLYAQARQLSQAGEWAAVVKIFNRITELDPDAPDPDGLLAGAQEKLAIQQKQAELEALYDRGVAALDSGRWEEAAGLLRQVDALEPGYEHASRLLNRAEAELARQMTPAVPDSAQTAPEPAASPPEEAPAAIPASEWAAALRPAISPALWIAAGWSLASLVALLLVLLIYSNDLNQLSYVLFVLVAGSLSGVALGIVLHRAALRLSRLQFLALVGAWSATGLLTVPFFSPDGYSAGYIISWFIAGALGGWATHAVLHRAGARFNRQAWFLIVLGWAVGLAGGMWLIEMWATPDTLSGGVIFLLGFALQGFFGGLALFAAWFHSYQRGIDLSGPEFIRQARAATPYAGEPAPEPDRSQARAEAKIRPDEQPLVTVRLANWKSILAPAFRPALWMGAGWFLAALAAVLFFSRYQGTSLVNSLSQGALEYFEIQLILSGLVAGLLSGAILGLVISRAGLRLGLAHILALMGIWALAFLATALFYILSTPAPVLLWFLTGALAGWATFAVMQRAGAALDRRALIWITVGWAIAVVAGEWLGENFYGNYIYYWLKDRGYSDFADQGWFYLFYGLAGALEGITGGLATFAAWFHRRVDSPGPST